MVHVREMDAADVEAVSAIRVRGWQAAYALYVSPDLTGQGTGRVLLDEAHTQMRSQGFDVSALWVLRDNQRAQHFYERAGYQADGAAQDDVYDGTTLTELRYQRVL
ncbi:GNAT family N-acetyltransferase [Streptomyces sp. NPDC019224]|uniref:GNAT family N-acetyltransferase n=1 Tax=Streptomyces sp. NPDC019224 TaxID=3154484 RepID=UPI0033FF57A8